MSHHHHHHHQEETVIVETYQQPVEEIIVVENGNRGEEILIVDQQPVVQEEIVIVEEKPVHHHGHHHERRQEEEIVIVETPAFQEVVVVKITAVCELMPKGKPCHDGSDEGNNTRGIVTFSQDTFDSHCIIEYRVTGLKPGLHGFHIHNLADFSNGCMSAGPHYNPHNKTHGGRDDEERHVGDLGNIEANHHGVAEGHIVDRLVKLSGEHSVIGRSIMVHADPDDCGKGGHKDSLTTGNAGARIACGEILIGEPTYFYQAPVQEEIIVAETDRRQEEDIVIVQTSAAQEEVVVVEEEKPKHHHQEKHVEHHHETRHVEHHHHQPKRSEEVVIMERTDVIGDDIIIEEVIVPQAKEGLLHKRARNRGVRALLQYIFGYPWTQRKIVLKDDRKYLYYYEGEELRGEISLEGLVAREASRDESDGREHAFGVFDQNNDLVILLASSTRDESFRWIDSINAISGFAP